MCRTPLGLLGQEDAHLADAGELHLDMRKDRARGLCREHGLGRYESLLGKINLRELDPIDEAARLRLNKIKRAA